MSDTSAVLSIVGMHCAGCQASVQQALSSVAGVREAKVDLGAKEARVTFDPGATTTAALVLAVKSAGYEAAVRATPAGP